MQSWQNSTFLLTEYGEPYIFAFASEQVSSISRTNNLSQDFC